MFDDFINGYVTGIMIRLTEAQRWRAVGMLQTGSNQVQTANVMRTSQSVVSRLWTRYRRTGQVADLQRSGRPKSTNGRDDRLVVNQALRNRRLTATDLQQYLRGVRGVNVSRQTIRNRLHAGELTARRPQVVLPLKARHRRARMAWCTQHRRWNINQWSNVMFSDESRFNLDFRDGRRRVWRRRGERFTDPARVAHDRYGGGSVMVWGGITMTGKTDLHVCQGRVTGQYYRDNVLGPYVAPFARRHGRGFIFQDDNARAHRARVVTEYLQRRNIRTMPWPAMSPDLSPIEHVWDILGKRVRRRTPPPRTLGELGTALEDEWRRIPQVTIRRLIGSMRRRCVACCDNRGGSTRY